MIVPNNVYSDLQHSHVNRHNEAMMNDYREY